MADLSPEKLEEIQEIALKAMANFSGMADKLETAIGALYMGQYCGWKGLYMFHHKRTIKQFEEILGIDFREYFPEEGPGIQRSMGYRAAEKIKKFWNVVNGDISVENKREISS
jgi:hypothetical protein